jgi:hypothetical protein
MKIHGITYSAEYNNDHEIERSRGGARHDRTRSRRKRTNLSNRLLKKKVLVAYRILPECNRMISEGISE